MTASLQVLYAAGDGIEFDADYYVSHHIPIVRETIGDFLETLMVTTGIAGPGGTKPAFHAIATMTFKDADQVEAALKALAPAVDDIKRFYNSKPQMVIGTVVS